MCFRTFLQNQGDQVMLLPQLGGSSTVDSVNVVELVPGRRSGGVKEVQLLTILAQGTTSVSNLGGWFRLSFNGSQTQTQWLSVSSNSSVVARALGQLNTMRYVTVSSAVISECYPLLID